MAAVGWLHCVGWTFEECQRVAGRRRQAVRTAASRSLSPHLYCLVDKKSGRASKFAMSFPSELRCLAETPTSPAREQRGS